jgi:tetratricopeptide (TPR) repeat protein
MRTCTRLFLAAAITVTATACRTGRDRGAQTAVTENPAMKSKTDPAGAAPLGEDHDHLYKRGVELIRPHIILNDLPVKVDAVSEKELREGIGYLDRALKLYPENWAALWLRGKALQAVGAHTSAHESFQAAYGLQAANPDVGRELVLECMEIGKFDEAVRVANIISRDNPTNAGLRANLALALVLAGRVAEAQKAVGEALELDPGDEVTQALQHRIDDVARGKRAKPKQMKDLLE